MDDEAETISNDDGEVRGLYAQLDMMREGVWRLLDEQSDDRKELREIARDIADLRVMVATIATQVGAIKFTREVSAVLFNAAAALVAVSGMIAVCHHVGLL